MSDPVSAYLDALAKLLPFTGVSFRGLPMAAEMPPEVGVVTTIVSSSRDPRVACGNF
jgi:hypothetical protein